MKLNKIILSSLAPLTLVGTASIVSSCGCSNKQSYHDVRFYKTPKIADTIYTITPPKDNYNQWYATLQSLQGILAQTEAKLFINSNEEARNIWIKPMKEQMGFKIVALTDHLMLLSNFKKAFNSKYVLYRDTDKGSKSLSIDKATTIAAAENVLMVEEKIEDTIKALGFTKAFDADDYTTRDLFTKYKDKLNNSMLINQKPDNMRLRDYAIASKSFTTYLDYLKEVEDQDICNEILSWTKTSSPILGWNEDEVKFVEAISQYSKVVTPSDHCCNYSFYSAYTPKKDYKQKTKGKIKAQQGKHYVAIVMSDGDNVQWLQNNFTSQKYFGNEYRGEFPLTWTLSPAVNDTNGVILDKLYSDQTENDNFICGPSGFGYINYDTFGKPEEFANISAQYMKLTDMHLVNFIDFYSDKKNPDAFIWPMKQDQIKGGIWAFGDWYIKGKGGVFWRNDKPVICMREGLWELGGKPQSEQFLSPTNVARRINKYSTNPKEISGYTVVSAHVWSYGEMKYVKQFVDMLDDHVELVTAQQLVDMVSENVPHIDVEEANDHPFKN